MIPFKNDPSKTNEMRTKKLLQLITFFLVLKVISLQTHTYLHVWNETHQKLPHTKKHELV